MLDRFDRTRTRSSGQERIEEELLSGGKCVGRGRPDIPGGCNGMGRKD